MQKTLKYKKFAKNLWLTFTIKFTNIFKKFV